MEASVRVGEVCIVGVNVQVGVGETTTVSVMDAVFVIVAVFSVMEDAVGTCR